MMDYHDEYAAINSRVHRKPALISGSPALVRHVAFWKPVGTERDVWIEAADRYIVAVYQAIKTHHSGRTDTLFVLNDTVEDNRATEMPDALDRSVTGAGHRRFYLFGHVFIDDGPDINRKTFRPIFPSGQLEKNGILFDPARDLTADQVPSHFRTVSFKFSYFGFTCWIKFELNQEYFSLSVVLDFAVLPRDMARETLLGHEPIRILQEAIDAINRETKSRYSALGKRSPSELIGLRRQAMVQVHRLIYRDFWKQFIDRDLLETKQAKPLLGQIGRIFYDTRGLILCMVDKPSVTETRGDRDQNAITEPAAPMGIATDLFPVAHSSSALETIQPEPFFTAKDGFDIDVCDAFWPFITALDKGKNDRVEYAASKFLNHRAMHITSLGNIPAAAQDVKVPVKFLLVTSFRNRWQIGRLIDRLFVLESSRVAALMNVEKLAEASQKLDQDFITLRQFQENRSGSGQDTQEKLAHFSKNLARLSNESGCDGGLDYRIGRSRYYVAQFKEMMETFRVDRIEGYQTFTEFTQRRFFTIYRSIDQLGGKLIAFRHQLDDLNDQIQAEQALANQSALVKLQRFVVQLQIAADLTLILPLTYYASHVSTEILTIFWANAEHFRGWIVLMWFIALAGFGIRRARIDMKRLRKLDTVSDASGNKDDE